MTYAGEYTFHITAKVLSESFGDATLAAREIAEQIFEQDDIIEVAVEMENPVEEDMLY